MSGQLLLIFLVSLVVFGPTKLPMLANHLGVLLRQVNKMKEQAAAFWQQQINEYQLHENELKAKLADEQYKEL